MNVKNSKNKNNNFQKPLPNIVTIFFFFFLKIMHSLVLFPFMFPQTFSLIYVNIKSNMKTLHTFCFEGAPRTKINARDCIKEREIYIDDQYLQRDIYL